jgi:hypothetical protein
LVEFDVLPLSGYDTRRHKAVRKPKTEAVNITRR